MSDVSIHEADREALLAASDALPGTPADALEPAAAQSADKPIPLWGYPATYLLMGINLIVFAIMCRHTPLPGFWRHHVWSEMFTSMFDYDKVVVFGGSKTSMVLHGEWWRLITATFVHANVLHILLNMWCLWNLCLFGEPLLGKRGLIAVYLLTGVAGNMLSLAWSMFQKEDGLVVGASGAVFGIAGILIVLLSNRRLSLPWEELRSLRMHVIFFAVINLAFGYAPLLLQYLPPDQVLRLHLDPANLPRVDNSAHLGGFISGLALGLPLFPRMTAGRSSYRHRQKITFAVAALVLCLVGYALSHAAQATV